MLGTANRITATMIITAPIGITMARITHTGKPEPLPELFGELGFSILLHSLRTWN